MSEQILIDKKQLENILLKYQNQIGYTIKDVFDLFVAGIGFIITIAFADMKHNFLWWFLLVLGIIYMVLGVKKMEEVVKNRIDQESLLKEINKLDEIEYRHSIIAIKNTFDKYPNKFLTYYDSDWDCDFFINYKTVNHMEKVIQEKLSNTLRIDPSEISVELKGEAIQRKYSFHCRKDKTYNHSFYLVKISHFNEFEQENRFEIDSKKYKWLSLDEMKNNQNTVKKNLDVINKIDELIS